VSPTLAQLKAAALHQVGRADEARGLLATIPPEAELEVEALEVLADDYGQLEGTGAEAFKRVRKLLLGWPKPRVLKVMQRLATREDGLTQWGALRFVDAEFAGQGLKLTELYLKALDAKDCARRRVAARRLGELKASAAVEKLTALKAEPRKRGGVLGLEEEDCGQGAASEALRRIERGQ
jgi:serine/threonine protein kinase, bacterial